MENLKADWLVNMMGVQLENQTVVLLEATLAVKQVG
jgi:hypothetical protein